MMQSNEVAPDMGASCGVRLKQAREQAGLSQEDVASRLKIPVRVLRQLESGDLGQLGAPVFVRGQLRSYAKLLGVDLEDQLSQSSVAAVQPSVLVSHTHTPRYKRVLEQTTRRAIYIVLTAALAVPIFWAMRNQGSVNQLPVQTLEAPAQPATGPAPASPSQPAPAPVQRQTLVASMVPSAAQPALAMEFTGESWVEITGADGRTLEQGLLGAGEQRRYAAGEVSRVKLGNSDAVQVRQGDKTVDLTPFSRGKVARFTLSSDGSLAPVAD